MTFQPLAPVPDFVLLIVRLSMGVVMVYYGWPKVKDPRKNAAEFDSVGFKPGVFRGGIVPVADRLSPPAVTEPGQSQREWKSQVPG